MTESSESGSFFKKWTMRQYWRMQQSQAVVSLLLWGTTITLLVWPLIEWRFAPDCTAGPCFSDEILGLSSTYFALAGIFFTVMFAVFTIGFLYDQVFSLWTEWRSVDMERNPFATYALAPIWAMVISLQAETLKRTSPDEPHRQRETSFQPFIRSTVAGQIMIFTDTLTTSLTTLFSIRW